MNEEDLNPQTTKQVDTDEMGSLEQGIAGDYQLEVREVIREAWQRSSGNKGTLWIAIIMY